MKRMLGIFLIITVGLVISCESKEVKAAKAVQQAVVQAAAATAALLASKPYVGDWYKEGGTISSLLRLSADGSYSFAVWSGMPLTPAKFPLLKAAELAPAHESARNSGEPSLGGWGEGYEKGTYYVNDGATTNGTMTVRASDLTYEMGYEVQNQGKVLKTSYTSGTSRFFDRYEGLPPQE